MCQLLRTMERIERRARGQDRTRAFERVVEPGFETGGVEDDRGVERDDVRASRALSAENRKKGFRAIFDRAGDDLGQRRVDPERSRVEQLARHTFLVERVD